MEEAKTWRELLGSVISNPSEKLRISKAANISPITLIRWTRHTSNPRIDNLRPLLNALPQYREKLSRLIAEEFPQFFAEDGTLEEIPEVSSDFYTRVLDIYSSNPPLPRRNLICNILIQQMLDQLDQKPGNLGSILALCVKPEPGRKVRSLYKIMGKANHYYGNDLESRAQFVGAESQMGSAVMRKHPIVTQTLADHRRLYPHQIKGGEESTAAFPILLSNQAAGALALACTRANFFTQPRLDLIQRYVNLLNLAFVAEDFYDFEMIELGILPPRKVQLLYTTDLQQRVTQYMVTRDDPKLTRPEAEIIVKREVEAELLLLTY